MSAVGVIVVWVVVVVYEIPSMNVVDETVPIVVFAVAWDFTGVCPHVRLQILVVSVYARVNDCSQNIFASGCLVPCLGAVDILVVRSACLTRVVHAPKLVPVGIVGHLYDGYEIVGFDDFDEVIDFVKQFPFFEMIVDGGFALDID